MGKGNNRDMPGVFVCGDAETSGECRKAMQPTPVTLTGPHVRLEPLARSHAADLLLVGAEADIWRYLPRAAPLALGDIETWIEAAHQEQAKGVRIPFAVIDASNGRAVGSTSYLDISPKDRRIEIGWTWLGAPARRTPINTECKYLLLRHAFETLGCGRVQLKTDQRNLRSQAAIERIGGIKEGVLRQHMVQPDGFVRDSVYYSIIASEWPGVKSRLEAMLRRPSP